uniref:DENN domain containing 6B n=1 Tax=Macaca fascicularis TaxID=9541 RepID=A0A7N9CK43_MACFA
MDALLGTGPRRARGCLGAAGPRSSGRAARTPAAPWARFSAWLECVCVVTFDLELGQALELVYPNDFRLTDKEKSSICYLSFPDSHSGCLGDTQFSFRMRQCGGQRSPWHADDRHYNSRAPVALQSLVLVSRLPFVRLFQALLSLIAPEYFDKLAPCLEAVCSEIDQWPAPAPGQTLNLPVMGVVVQVRIPSRVDKSESSPPKQCDQENLLPAPMVLASVHELDLFRCFRPVLTHVQTLWELVLLGEPLLVLAPSPDVSSEMVLALTSCLQPLRFCCDFRPYFTIHDSEFKEFTTRTQAPPNVVLGVTNPFFIKTLQHWPHILRVGEPKMSGDLPKQVKLKKPSRLKTLDTKPGLYTAYTAHLHRDKALLKRLLKGVQKKRPSDVQSALLRRHLLELTQSFIIPLEHYMASLMPLQKSITPWKTPPQIRPFSQDDFLRSLEHAGPQLTCILKGDWLGLYRWVDCGCSLSLPWSPGSAPRPCLPVPRVSPVALPVRLQAQPRGPACLSPGSALWPCLSVPRVSPGALPVNPHRRFFKSPHFDGWYRQRHKEMALKLEALHLEAICEAVREAGGWGGPEHGGGGHRPRAVGGLADSRPHLTLQNIETWMKDKSEVEVVDLVLKLREKLVRCLPALSQHH